MLLSEVKATLHAVVATGEDDARLAQVDINTACGSDLLSDVLAFVKDQSLLLTGLVNTQVIRTAEMMDIIAICFVRGKDPTDEIIELAKEKGIAVLMTEYPMYLACGKLYEKGLGGSADAQNV